NTADTATWSGPITLTGDTAIFLEEGTFAITGSIGGHGNLTAGGLQEHLVLAGPTPNTYGGTTTITSRTPTPPQAPGVTAVPGDLVVGAARTPPPGVGDLAHLRLQSDDQIADSATVTVRPFSDVNLNDHSETFAALTLGGDIRTGPSGILTMLGDVTAVLA